MSGIGLPRKKRKNVSFRMARDWNGFLLPDRWKGDSLRSKQLGETCLPAEGQRGGACLSKQA